MSPKYQSKAATGPKTVLAAAALGSFILTSPQIASAVDPHTQERISAGYEASPVPINLAGKDPAQVGIGSYIVNGTGVCNHCHSVNQYHKAVYPQNYATQSGNPYLLPKPNGPYKGGIFQGKATFIVDHTTHLAGGQGFGPFFDSKNLTPAPNGNVANPTPSTPFYAAGGIDWITFWGVLHNGVDIDQLYQQCTGTNTPPGCLPAPSNAYELQVMPWTQVRLLTDSDLNAVWQYLGSIPCNTNLTNENGPKGSNIANTYGGGVLINDCSTTTANASYKFYKYESGKLLPRT
jgi:hypothetical protein